MTKKELVEGNNQDRSEEQGSPLLEQLVDDVLARFKSKKSGVNPDGHRYLYTSYTAAVDVINLCHRSIDEIFSNSYSEYKNYTRRRNRCDRFY